MNVTSLFPISFRPKYVRARVCSVPISTPIISPFLILTELDHIQI